MATTGHENEAVKISGLKANEKKLVNLLPFNEVICSTAAATAAKVANTTPASFNLVAKATIVVKFTYGITVANATFQVGTTAAKPIYYKGAALPANLVKAGMTVTLRYDGTNYNVVGTLDNETDIAYDSTNKKITKTINGTTSDVMSVYSKGDIDALRAPVYDATNKRITFPATAAFTYDSTNKSIIISQ